jgi:predicted transposase/invertase (TIGR01784 family)
MQWSERVEEADGRKVKQEISSPHDKLFKQLLGEPENAASFLADNLASEIASHLDLTTLQVVQVSFIDTQFIQSEADLLFSVTIDGRPGYAYFLFEHQSSPDGFMLLRLIGYMVRVWKRFHAEKPEWDRLPAIIPMVLFHCPKGWQGPLSFQDLVHIPAESFAPYTPAFQCKV